MDSKKARIKSIKVYPLYSMERTNDSIVLRPDIDNYGPSYTTVEFYDTAGNVTDRRTLNDEKIIKHELTLYDFNGNVISKKHSSLGLNQTTHCIFNFNNHIIEEKILNENGETEYSSIFFYNEKKLLSASHHDSVYDLLKNTYLYDEQNRLIELCEFSTRKDGSNNADELVNKNVYEYLENGIKIEKQLEYGYGFRNQLKFDSENRLIEEFDQLSGVKVVYIYSDVLLTEKVYYHVFEDSEIFQSIETFFYDAFKNLIETRSYNSQYNTSSATFYRYTHDVNNNWIEKYTYFNNPDILIEKIKGCYEKREITYY